MQHENVSRETGQRLEHFSQILKKWNSRINLVAPGTVDSLHERHIEDSLQLRAFAKPGQRWLDLGSGGGFPGLVLAISEPGIHVTLVDSDQRKCTFLRSVLRELRVQAEVVTSRIEAMSPRPSDVVSARALAPLPQLLGYAAPHLKTDAHALFLKGRMWQKEVEQARETWDFMCEAHRSQTDQDAVVLEISGVSHVGR